MRSLDRREKILTGSTAVLLALIVLGVTQETGQPVSQGQWQEIELKDVNSGERFKVAQLEKPVLIETFAVWCPTCTKQQTEIKELKENSDVTSVSLDVDPNEDEKQIKRHTRENGFKWRYAVSPTELTQMLVNRYGTTVTNPPSAPVILVCENGSRKLSDGVKSASKLQTEVEKGC